MAEQPANEKRRRQLKEESQLPFRQAIMIRMSIFQGSHLIHALRDALSESWQA